MVRVPRQGPQSISCGQTFDDAFVDVARFCARVTFISLFLFLFLLVVGIVEF